MDETWENFLNEIKYDNRYRELFYKAFGILNPDSTHAAKALASLLEQWFQLTQNLINF